MTDDVTAVVTAACGAIGSAVVARLNAVEGVDRVIGVDVRVPRAKPPAGVELWSYDLRRPQDVATFAERAPDGLAIVVNVLGGEAHPPVCPVEDVAWPPAEVWDDIMDLNLSSAYRIMRALRGKLAVGAAVCNVSSIAATMPWAVSPAYGAAKAALEHWSSSLAVLLAGRGIRVNLVRPGFVWSEQWRSVDRAEFDRVADDRVLLRAPGSGRAQRAADIAESVTFLCSPAAAHVTGQAINVDGGAALTRAAR